MDRYYSECSTFGQSFGRYSNVYHARQECHSKGKLFEGNERFAGYSELVDKLYPNPVKSVLNITGLSSNAVVSIYNTAGVKLNIKTGSEINVAGLTKGMYIVSIYTPEGVINKTFLKD